MSIRSYIKGRSSIKKYAYGARRVLYYSMLAINRPWKTDKMKVLLNNFQGKGYAGNPRAIAESLHRMNPDVKLLWVCDGDKSAESLPPYVKPVSIDSANYYHEVATSGTWVFNILPARGLLKRKDQLYIQTYHGDRSPKKLHYQNVGKKETDYKYAIHDEICDYGVTGSAVGERMFREAIGFHGKLLKFGMPRNDCLVNIDEELCREIRSKLGLTEDEYLVLYAPTFRQGESQLKCEINFDRLLDVLEQKTGKKCICLYRAHFHTNNISFSQQDNNRMINVSGYTDMADLLMIADMLITDYSSSAGDFCVKHKPVILFMDETETYNRKLLYDIAETPHFIAHNQDELEELVSELDEEKTEKNCDELIKFFGIYDSGQASMKVSEVILDHIDKN